MKLVLKKDDIPLDEHYAVMIFNENKGISACIVFEKSDELKKWIAEQDLVKDSAFVYSVVKLYRY